ncbi:MAG: FHA domain-containing protein [Polyangiaceae bacterium]
MNVSAACPQCGAIANPNDRFCNTCGNPLQRPGAPGAPAAQPAQQAPPQYAQQPPPAQPYGQPQYPQQGYPPPQQAYAPPAARPARCQQGHEIMPGMSYCAQGHPIALDAMQFANDPNAPYAQPQQPPQGYGAPGYGAQPPGPPQQYPPAPAQGLGFGGAQPYQPPPQQAYGGPPPGYPQAAPQPVFQPAAVPPPQQGMYAPPPPPQPVYPTDTSPDRVPVVSKQLRAFVVTFQSNPAGDFWPLSTGRTTVGRANAPEPADVALADATISSRHAAFNIDLSTVVVEDTNSTNGTYVNEEHIGQNGKRELRDGDRVRFGGYTTQVKILGRLG